MTLRTFVCKENKKWCRALKPYSDSWILFRHPSFISGAIPHSLSDVVLGIRLKSLFCLTKKKRSWEPTRVVLNTIFFTFFVLTILIGRFDLLTSAMWYSPSWSWALPTKAHSIITFFKMPCKTQMVRIHLCEGCLRQVDTFHFLGCFLPLTFTANIPNLDLFLGSDHPL